MDLTQSSIAATINLTDERQRRTCELIRRFHTGRWPVFGRMLAIRLDGGELVELTEWRRGGFTVVRWSLTEIALRWQDQPNLHAARQAFLKSSR